MHPYPHLWIILDCLLMFLTLGYVYMTQLMKVYGEITKNLFSLYFLQTQEIEKLKNKKKVG